MANYLAAFRLEHGAYPPDLIALTYFGPSLPADPFSGMDFWYQRESGGYRLWSEGSDGTNDNGERVYHPKNGDLSLGDIVHTVSSELKP